MLSRLQIAQYHENGYLIPNFRVSENTLDDIKSAHGKLIERHPDGEYWPMRPLATCTVWIAVDDSTTENGCLRVVRGSHKDKRVRQHVTNDAPGLALNEELPTSEFDQNEAVDLALKAGQISLHDVFLVHGSEPNRSAHSRRGMTLRFMPTTSHYDRDIEYEQNRKLGLASDLRRPVYLMRGIDQCGRNDFENEPPRCP